MSGEEGRGESTANGLTNVSKDWPFFGEFLVSENDWPRSAAPGGPPEGRGNLRTLYVLGEWKRGEGREHSKLLTNVTEKISFFWLFSGLRK